jgi:hypothetical protein
MREIRIDCAHHRVIVGADENRIAIGGQAMKRRRAYGAAGAWDILRYYRAAQLGLQGIRQDAPHYIRHATNAHGDDHAQGPRLGKRRGSQAKRSSGKQGTTQHGKGTFRFCHAAT